MSQRVEIIAEAGVNHNGDMGLARELVHAAAEAGADIVKFQTFFAHELVTFDAGLAPYQRAGTAAQNQFDMLQQLELSWDQHAELIEHCNKVGVEFLSSAFSTQNLDRLLELGIRRIKVPSGEVTNLPYLRHVAGLSMPVILSTGMSDMDEVEAAVNVLKQGRAIQRTLSKGWRVNDRCCFCQLFRGNEFRVIVYRKHAGHICLALVPSCCFTCRECLGCACG